LSPTLFRSEFNVDAAAFTSDTDADDDVVVGAGPEERLKPSPFFDVGPVMHDLETADNDSSSTLLLLALLIEDDLFRDFLRPMISKVQLQIQTLHEDQAVRLYFNLIPSSALIASLKQIFFLHLC